MNPGGPRARRLRPQLWPTLIALPALAALLALGTWQLERLAWKRALIAERDAALAAAPQSLPAGAAERAALDYTRVRARGTFVHERELYLVGRARAGVGGVHVLTPLHLDDGTGAVVIDRGFVPEANRAPATRTAGQITGPVTIEGSARRPGRRNLFTPDNRPEANEWYWLDRDAMGAAVGLNLLSVVIVAGTAANPGGLPVGTELRSDLRNDHLGYALTWYGLAAALVVIYVVFHLRRPTLGPA